MDRTNRAPLHFEVLADTDGVRYVREELFYKVLARVRNLMEDKAEAERTHDPTKLADCARREDGLREYIDSYEHMRNNPLVKGYQ